MKTDFTITREAAKTPRAAAIAGIIFSVLLMTALVLIRLYVPSRQQDAGEWMANSWKTVNFALSLVPFAGIAFLWFIGVLRDRLGDREDRFFATVFLGSGLLFLALLFVTTAIVSSLIVLNSTHPGSELISDIYPFGRALTYELMNVYTMKMAGVFMLSTCTLAMRTGFLPKWAIFIGYGLAFFLIIALSYFPWVTLAFPLWVLLLSIHILVTNYRKGPATIMSGPIE